MMMRAILLIIAASFNIICNAEVIARDNSVTSLTQSWPVLLTTPSTLESGAINRVCLSRFAKATSGSVVINVDVTPVEEERQDNDVGYLRYAARVQKKMEKGNGGCFDLFIPKLDVKSVNLNFIIRSEIWPSIALNMTRILPVIPEKPLTILQTEKPLYRPGETIKLRILVLKTDLTPVQATTFSASLEASSTAVAGFVRVMQWPNLRSHFGLIHLEYTLDKYAAQGTWRLSVQNDGGFLNSVNFQVTHYTLPSYNVIIDFPKNISNEAKQVTWTYCVRYPWGLVPRGQVLARFRRIPAASEKTIPDRTASFDQARQCANFTLSASDLEMNTSSIGVTYVAAFDFQEYNSMAWKNTSVISTVVDSRPALEILSENIFYFGLPYKVKVKATDFNQSPLKNARLKFCYETFSRKGSENFNLTFKSSCVIVKTNIKGIVEHSLKINEKNQSIIIVKVNLLDGKNKATKGTAAKPVEAKKEISIDNDFPIAMNVGEISWDDSQGTKVAKLTSYINFGKSSSIAAVTLHYIIVTRGGILSRWGAVTLCPLPLNNTKTKLQSVAPGTICYHNTAEDGVYRITLTFRLMSQMCPRSHIVLYFYHDGNLIAANKEIILNDCFTSKVQHRWSPKIAAPGSTIRMYGETHGPAICASVVRHASLNTFAVPQTIQTGVEDALISFGEMKRNFNDLYDSLLCGKEKALDKKTWYAFHSSGLDFLTNQLPEFEICTQEPQLPLELQNQETKNERSYFPETFLWDLKLVPNNGSFVTEATLPDSIAKYESEVFCISKSGLAVGRKANLTVIKEMFVDFVSPKLVKRYEQFEAYFKVYNYANETLAISVSLATSEGLESYLPSGQRYEKKTICLSSYESYTEYLVMSASKIGDYDIVVEANIDHGLQKHCGGNNFNGELRDRLKKNLTVTFEGIIEQVYKSALLCPEDGNELVKWDWEPKSEIEDSNKWIISIVGDVAGSMFLDIDKMLPLPMGCGEQNMALLSYNLISLQYMDTIAKYNNTVLRKKIVTNIVEGYQKQMTRYQHSTGGFSAFGRTDTEPSTWLTAFCVRYLHRLTSILGWEMDLKKHVDWLLSLQLENGCFKSKGQVFHDEYKGGVASPVSLTAYVVIALVESNVKLHPKILNNAGFCLEAHPVLQDKLPKSDQLFSFVLSAYATVKVILQRHEAYNKYDHLTANLEDHSSGEKYIGVVDAIRATARRRDDLIWWECDTLAVSLETTSYAALILMECLKSSIVIEECGKVDKNMFLNDIASALRWISLHRNIHGGFISTQDTLIGTEALISYSKLQSVVQPSVSVTLELGSWRKEVKIEAESNAIRLERYGDGQLTVRTSGVGCVTVQACQQYNVYLPLSAENSPFSLKTKISTDGQFDCKRGQGNCKCAAKLEVCVSWISKSMQFPEMSILEITMPTNYRTDVQLQYSLLKQENTLLRRIEENIDASKIFMYLMPNTALELKVHECYQLYLIGPRVGKPKGSVRVYDYYKPNNFNFQEYTIPNKCSSNKGRSHQEFDSKSNMYTQNLIFDAAENIKKVSNNFEKVDKFGPADGIFEKIEVNNVNQDIPELLMSTIEENLKIANNYSNKINSSNNKDDENCVKDVKRDILNENKSKTNDISKSDMFLGNKTENSLVNFTNNDDNISEIFKEFHVIDSKTDLATPDGIEGPYTEYVLPPKGFAYEDSYAVTEIFVEEQLLPPKQFENWTEVETDLAFPEGLEGNYETIVKPDNQSIKIL